MMEIIFATLALCAFGLICFGLMRAVANEVERQGYQKFALYLRVLYWTLPLQLAYVVYKRHQTGALGAR